MMMGIKFWWRLSKTASLALPYTRSKYDTENQKALLTNQRSIMYMPMTLQERDDVNSNKQVPKKNWI